MYAIQPTTADPRQTGCRVVAAKLTGLEKMSAVWTSAWGIIIMGAMMADAVSARLHWRTPRREEDA
jgi:hypothetical protein